MSIKGAISTHFEIGLEFEDEILVCEIHIRCPVCTERKAARGEWWGGVGGGGASPHLGSILPASSPTSSAQTSWEAW